MVRPVVLPGVSRRGTRVPISVQRSGVLSVTSAGTASAAASEARAPKRDDLPEGCETTPLATAISPAGTCQDLAAAATSMARAAAPARRICVQELAVEVEPPVPCTGPNRRLL